MVEDAHAADGHLLACGGVCGMCGLCVGGDRVKGNKAAVQKAVPDPLHDKGKALCSRQADKWAEG